MGWDYLRVFIFMTPQIEAHCVVFQMKLNSGESNIVWHILTDVKRNSKISILGQKRSCILCNFRIFTILNLIQIPQPNSLKTHSRASLANTWVEWLQAYILYQIENNIPKMWSCPFNIFFQNTKFWWTWLKLLLCRTKPYES